MKSIYFKHFYLFFICLKRDKLVNPHLVVNQWVLYKRDGVVCKLYTILICVHTLTYFSHRAEHRMKLIYFKHFYLAFKKIFLIIIFFLNISYFERKENCF